MSDKFCHNAEIETIFHKQKLWKLQEIDLTLIRWLVFTVSVLEGNDWVIMGLHYIWMSYVCYHLISWVGYQPLPFNPLGPGSPGCHFKTAIFNLVLLIDFFRSFNDNAPRWMPWDLTDDKSTSVQVMAWCHQATSHYLSQCWPSSMSPYGVTRPQWVNSPLLQWDIDGLVQDCSNSSALAMELLQSCTKPSICTHTLEHHWFR